MRKSDHLIIHEWGTFTSLQDELGRTLCGLNVDDEPVPEFVHRATSREIVGSSVRATSGITAGQYSYSKGLQGVHPDVTMRLETPVLYAYAPPGFSEELDVRVAFHGGWLTEFFPNADSVAPGLPPDGNSAGHCTGETVGTLHWPGLKVEVGGDTPKTDAQVWLAPRRVGADTLRAASGEAEKFLFYRGVGHVDAMLSFTRDEGADRITVSHGPEPEDQPGKIWLADIQPDGRAAFRMTDAAEAAGSSIQMRASFSPWEYGTGKIAELRSALDAELVAQGLYEDEAEALLNTWQVSYFQNPGLRAFFVTPRAWTDRLLPLQVTPRAEITRVMIGRVEMVSPEQRAAVRQIASGRLAFEEAVSVYRKMGRFAEALVLDEQARRPTPVLAEFTRHLGLAYAGAQAKTPSVPTPEAPLAASRQ